MHTCSHLITAVLPKLDPPDNLLIDEVCSNRIISWIVPRSKDLLAEEESPWCVALLGTHLLGVLLTLRDGVHDVVTSTTQGGDLSEEVGRGGGEERRGRKREEEGWAIVHGREMGGKMCVCVWG